MKDDQLTRSLTVTLSERELRDVINEHSTEEHYWRKNAERVKGKHLKASEGFRKRAIRHKLRANELRKILKENAHVEGRP